MKKVLLIAALCAPFAVHTGLNAMQELKDQSYEVANKFFESIKTKLAEGTLKNTGVRDALEKITIEKKGHGALVDRAFDEHLAGPDGEVLLKYFKDVRAKIKAGEPLSQTEKEQAKAIYQLIMTKQSLKETERFKDEFHPAALKALE